MLFEGKVWLNLASCNKQDNFWDKVHSVRKILKLRFNVCVPKYL